MGTKTRSAYCLSGWCSVSTLQISHGVEATERCNYLASVLLPQLVAARRSCNQQSCRPKYPSRFTRQLQVASDRRRADDGGPPSVPSSWWPTGRVPPQQLQHRTPAALSRTRPVLLPALGASQCSMVWIGWRTVASTPPLRWINVRPPCSLGLFS